MTEDKWKTGLHAGFSSADHNPAGMFCFFPPLKTPQKKFHHKKHADVSMHNFRLSSLIGVRPHQCSQSHWYNFPWLIQDLNIPEANVNTSFRMWQTGSGGGFRCTEFRLTCPHRVRKLWKYNVENTVDLFRLKQPAHTQRLLSLYDRSVISTERLDMKLTAAS